MLSPVFGAPIWVLHFSAQPASIAKTQDFCVLGSHLPGHRAFSAETQMAGHPREKQGLWETLAARERRRDGGGAAAEEPGSHTSQSQDPG